MQKMFNNSGQEFTILEKKGNKVVVIFSDTGYVKKALYHNVVKGKCRDPYALSRYGVGYHGVIKNKPPFYKQGQQLWSNMLKRCYTDDPKGYKWKGTTVDKRWQCLANFLEDLPELEGFDKWLVGGMNLDKDTKYPGNNVYSKDACIFLEEGINKSLGAKTTVSGYRRTLQKLEGKS